MLHLPLLSHAYEAALFGPDESRPVPAEHPRAQAMPLPFQPESPTLDEEGEDGTVPTVGQPDDLETARTRPLRLDRLTL